MLPDYMVYDELERMKREREAEFEREQPRLEVPRYYPMWPEEELAEESDSEEGSERGVIIIQM